MKLMNTDDSTVEFSIYFKNVIPKIHLAAFSLLGNICVFSHSKFTFDLHLLEVVSYFHVIFCFSEVFRVDKVVT